jgi:hypothetical protein
MYFKILKRRDNLENLGVDGRAVLKCSSNKYGVRLYNEFYWLDS